MRLTKSVAVLILLPLLPLRAASNDIWTIHITNDNCPDYTWGLTEEQTRRAFADIVRAHLDEMNRTESWKPASRDHYNMAVMQEAMCFVERYPERRAELLRRIKEGRVFVSPFLCNSLWAFHSTECALRTLYPARRLERDEGIAIDVAEHIEEPSLPWGMATILAGAGIRWLSVPFYNYDSTFTQLRNPPLSFLEGPDGSRLRVILDPWTSNRANYVQGAALLRKPQEAENEWVPHYRDLGERYPLRTILASGTHGDIAPRSGDQAHGFAEAIANHNAAAGVHPRFLNATVAQFCAAVDQVEARQSFLPVLRGCFGHSWDLWPVSLAKYAADMREAERSYLAAETLLALAACNHPSVGAATRPQRERAEWCWAMLSDHAWNGTDTQNKRHNAQLRREWAAQFAALSATLMEQGWVTAGLRRDAQTLTVFNSLSFPRGGLVRLAAAPDINTVTADGQALPCQVVQEQGERILYFVAPPVAAFSFRQFRVDPAAQTARADGPLSATAAGLESPFYRLSFDRGTGAVVGLVHKASGQQLCPPGSGGLCRTVFFDGREHPPQTVTTEVVTNGPVLARVKVTTRVQGIEIANCITLYAELDQMDFDVRIHKPVTTQEQRLCQVFPLPFAGAELRLETPAAVLRPRLQPQGDLLPGADTRRFAVQGFVDASAPQGPGFTIAPLDAFALRLDLGAPAFEALGNDQNYREVTQDQDGVTGFRFRYILRGHAGGYDNAEAVAWSRDVAMPLVSVPGHLDETPVERPTLRLDRSRAVATCLKPADGDGSGGLVLRLWETAGSSAPVRIDLAGFRRAFQTDLLERDQRELVIRDGRVEVKTNACGLCGLRLLP